MSRKCVEWFTRTYKSRNGVVEKTKYPVCLAGKGANRRERRRAARRAGRAGDNAERQAARLLNNNFFGDDALHLTLTYSEAGYKKLLARADQLRAEDLPERDRIFRAAQKELENFVRRVQYDLKGFKYFAVTSDMDGETGDPVRVHHHVVAERESLQACKKKWEKMGLVLEKELYSINGDMTPLASYLIKQVRYIPDNKRYTHSRNLAAPEITEPLEVTRYAESEISIPTGALLLYRPPYSRGTSQYVRYLSPAGRKQLSGCGKRQNFQTIATLEREQIENRSDSDRM